MENEEIEAPYDSVARENQKGVDEANEREDDEERETPEEEAQRIRDESEEERLETINERVLKITGSANLEDDLKFGNELGVVLRGSLVKTELKDNNDGSFNKIYKVKLLTLEQIEEV